MGWGFVPISFDTIKPRKFMSRMGKTDGQREKRGHEFNFDIFLVVGRKSQIKKTQVNKKLLTKIRKNSEARNNLVLVQE